MLVDAPEMAAPVNRSYRWRPRFRSWRPRNPETTRSKLYRFALACLRAFYEDVGGADGLSFSDKLDIENAAIDVGRLRMLQLKMVEEPAEVPASDMAAAAHLARKGRSTVARIARRMEAKRKRAR